MQPVNPVDEQTKAPIVPPIENPETKPVETTEQPTKPTEAIQEPNPKNIIKENDTVVIYMGVSNMRIEKMRHGDILNIAQGCFQHSHIIGRIWGSKILSFNKGTQGFIYVLKPSPTLITQTLARKTQILFTMDISAIIFKLNLLPGDTVVEAGTGSGSLSCSLATAIGEKGHLYTFEFNAERAKQTKDNFVQLGFKNITVTHQDIVEGAFAVEGVDYEADALFLDVPNPWDAVAKAKGILKTSGRMCCFSPCIEQVQKTCEQLARQKFTRIQTHECLSRTLQRRDKPTQGGRDKTTKSQPYFSTGPKTIRGHTGYLTFAYL